MFNQLDLPEFNRRPETEFAQLGTNDTSNVEGRHSQLPEIINRPL